MMARWLLVVVLGATAAALAGCATTPSTVVDEDGPTSRTSTSASSATCSALGEFIGRCTVKPTCPDHWHATQAVFVPTGTQDSNGYDAAKRLDWESPLTASGQHYYDFGRNAKMSISVHMHQSGAEQGSDGLGATQIHYEGGKCVGLQKTFAVIDLIVSDGHLEVMANSPLAGIAANHGGPWSDDADQRLRFFLQGNATGSWSWAEHDVADYLHHQLKDGEAVLLAFGHYSDADVQDMQAQVPAPISRRHGPEPSDAPPR